MNVSENATLLYEETQNIANKSLLDDNTTYCDLVTFSVSYRSVHGYLSILVCVFGSIANILNICVLSRREMRSPTNAILTGLAVADLLVMLEYIPFSCHVYFDPNARYTASYFSYGWAIFMAFHALFAQVCHFISICLTVVLAIWRYIIISSSQSNREWCNAYRTKVTIILTYLLCPLVCLPLFVSLKITEQVKSVSELGRIIQQNELPTYAGEKHNATLYVLDYGHFKEISFWVYGVVIKLVPCILLTILSQRIISALLETKRRRRNLLGQNAMNLKLTAEVNVPKTLRHNKEQQTDRTTRMLLAVLFLFLITEFPQAILGLLSVSIGSKFERQCYNPLGDLMDILALTNSAINFILYCAMSRQFRTAFQEAFRPKFLNRWTFNAQPSPEIVVTETQVSHV
ncbi:hypothetical protein PPYR_12293 [Photinus pyralis]|uniref:G-protein coupled receptors family 1 profile domain-containing protein n=1 Tax=Photinus pyralis TaxID=7054 RepID=A0A5N4ADR2_PHOPY|nr:sex peptide receptor-like [Photinus pyralis]KAB0795454.1 hypothetical protein PPYR_12293 [Photinus pyralis]